VWALRTAPPNFQWVVCKLIMEPGNGHNDLCADVCGDQLALVSVRSQAESVTLMIVDDLRQGMSGECYGRGFTLFIVTGGNVMLVINY